MYYRYWAHAPRRPGHFGIRNDRYKLAFFYGSHLGINGAEKKVNTEPAWEFFDLQNDPGENRNAYNDPKYQSIIQDMKQELLKLREEVGDTDEQFPEMEQIISNHWG
jgi:hypothetical protein